MFFIETFSKNPLILDTLPDIPVFFTKGVIHLLLLDIKWERKQKDEEVLFTFWKISQIFWLKYVFSWTPSMFF